jgi:hypothetical protein
MAMIKESNFGENEVVNVTVRKKKNPFLENFGILKGKLKKTTEEILNESDKEGWDE